MPSFASSPPTISRRRAVRHDRTPPPTFPSSLEEVVHALAVAPGETHVDGTFGAGGYTKAILDKGAARVFAFDRDPDAIQYGEALAASGERLTLVPERFSRMRQALAAPRRRPGRRRHARHRRLLDAARPGRARLLLPGRRPARHAHGPGRARAPPTSSTRPTRPRSPTSSIHYGEEPKSRRVARAIVAARPIERTGQLAEVVRKALGHHPGMKKDPATRTFQAIRIHVNEELAGARGRAGGRRAGARARRPPRRRHLPQPRGPDREALPQGAQRRRSRPARATCRPAPQAGPAPTFEAVAKAGPRRRGRARRQSPRALGDPARRAPHRRPRLGNQEGAAR